jgi:2,3-bisphosphoglycerate-independent phosphoglycerate mutase
MLRIKDAPIMDEETAGRKLCDLSRDYDFSLFEYWASDYAGHKQDMDKAIQVLESFDKILTGLFSSWKDEEGLILITSDHGNMEDLSTRRHTYAKVPAIIIGDEKARLDCQWFDRHHRQQPGVRRY